MSGEAESRGFEPLLRFLQLQRGFDFGGYKRPSLMRRVRRRMQAVGIEGFLEYTDYLQAHPEEFGQLFNTILINVTSFFRDEAAWQYLNREVVPVLARASATTGQIRVWSAGCASGEEAYTIAILLAEALGDDVFRGRVKIYATDIDKEALTQARLAVYANKDLERVPDALRARYFKPLHTKYAFRGDLRRSVIFGRNDLVQDAPISRLDLLICRNTLMYFDAPTQARILRRFHFALNAGGRASGGFLFLGRAEMRLTHSTQFTPLDSKLRIFAKVPHVGARRIRPSGSGGDGDGGDMNRQQRLREQANEESPVARIVIDVNGNVVVANQRARVMFGLSPHDVGRRLQDLEVSYRPIDLRSLVEQAHAQRRAVTQTSVEQRCKDGEVQYLDVKVQPLYEDGQQPLGAAISFLDVTRYYQLQEELRRSKEEVQTTNEALQSSNEELETTNEELQSSNEELETTNEELQSTNEELEAMNEELQSTNEELQAVNEELRQRTDELHHVNAFLESVLSSLKSGAVVVDPNLDVLVWNARAEDLWGLRADEVQGKSLLNLDIGLPLAELRAAIRQVLSGESPATEVLLDATNRRGKTIRCRVTCTPLLAGKRRDGAIILMEQVG